MAFLITVTVIALFIVFTLVYNKIANRHFKVKEYKIKSKDIPKGFNDFVIAQVSDLHDNTYGEDNCELLSSIGDMKPDIVVITGDLLNGNDKTCKNAVKFVKNVVKIAPTYFVNGNHEQKDPENYENLKQVMSKAGVVSLVNDKTELCKNGDIIELAGICDATYLEPEETSENIWKQCRGSDRYIILLSHHPEMMEDFYDCQVDLVLTGHTHAGQFRVPVIGSVYIPNQGFFPKYDVGLYKKEETAMIISSGLGATFLNRVYCPAQLVKIVLKSEE